MEPFEDRVGIPRRAERPRVRPRCAPQSSPRSGGVHRYVPVELVITKAQGKPRTTLRPTLPAQQACVCPGMATGYFPLASGTGGGADSQV